MNLFGSRITGQLHLARWTSRLPRLLFPVVCLVMLRSLATQASGAGTAPGALPGYEIIRLGRGHYNRLCLAASVAGTRGLLMLDTGASFTLLSDGRYKSLLSAADHKLPAGVPATISVNGMRSPVAMAPGFQVGNTDIGTLPVCLVASSYLYDHQMLYVPGSDRQYDGLLGENILRHYHAIVDCGRMALYLNTDPARKVNLGPAFTHAGWTRVPMTNFGNDFTVPCALNGHHFRLVVDTGAPFTHFDKDKLSNAHLYATDISLRGGVIGSQPKAGGYLALDSLRVGDYTSETTQVMVTPGLGEAFEHVKAASSDTPVLGLLGGNFLANNGAIIDVSDQTLYLKRADAASSGGQR